MTERELEDLNWIRITRVVADPIFDGNNLRIIGLVCVVFFFFQAEDGIRDRNVTGVQTWCSSDLAPACLAKSRIWLLPVLRKLPRACPLPLPRQSRAHPRARAGASLNRQTPRPPFFESPFLRARSEERRVGKECRSRESIYHVIK